jgi:hypothetical protein
MNEQIDKLEKLKPISDELLNELASKDESKRLEAEIRIKEQGQEMTASLIARLELEGKKRKRRQKFVTWIIGLYFAVLMVFLLGYVVHGLWSGSWGRFPWELFRVFQFSNILVLATAVNGAQKGATRALAMFDDIRSVGVLTQALEFGDRDVVKVARDALVRNLPLLKSNDSEYLNDDQRKCLHCVIAKPDKDFDLSLAILAALDQVGDDRDVAAVRKLAETEAATSNQKKLRGRAVEILPGLEARAEVSKAAHILLRAASSPDSPEASLLRPAQGVAAAPEEQLLRPVIET